MKKRKRSFARFLLIVVALMFVTAFAIVVVLSTTGTAHAERVATVENGTLVVNEVVRVAKIPGVPRELWNFPDIADKLMTGEMKDAVIEDKVGKTFYSFSFPTVRQRTEYSDKAVTYIGASPEKPWRVVSAAIKSEEPRNNSKIAFFCFWMPAILIAVISIVNLLSGVTVRKILFFYGMMLTAVAAGTVLGISEGSESGAFLGALAGALIGLFSNVFPDDRKFVVLLLLASLFAGAMLGGSAGLFAGPQNYKILLHYCIFLLVVKAVSFGIAKLVYHARKRGRAPIELDF